MCKITGMFPIGKIDLLKYLVLKLNLEPTPAVGIKLS